MRIKITSVVNSDNQHMVGKEIEIERTGSMQGTYGAFFRYQGKERFIPQGNYELTSVCLHEWVETGLVSTWCKICDIDGYFNRGHAKVDWDKYYGKLLDETQDA